MKAILVIDLPDKLNKAIDEIRVDIKANLYGNEILDWRNQRIKPMPEKYSIGDDDYIDGWNDCIDEILGGEKKMQQITFRELLDFIYDNIDNDEKAQPKRPKRIEYNGEVYEEFGIVDYQNVINGLLLSDVIGEECTVEDMTWRKCITVYDEILGGNDCIDEMLKENDDGTEKK